MLSAEFRNGSIRHPRHFLRLFWSIFFRDGDRVGDLGLQHLRLQDAHVQQARVPGLGRGPRLVHRGHLLGAHSPHGRRADREGEI
jgi:hypothetical protein